MPWLFLSERGQPLTRQSVNYLLAAAAARAGLPAVEPHMLRHSCGYLSRQRGYDLRLIQDYLGHRDPKHTVHYTRTAGQPVRGAVAMSGMAKTHSRGHWAYLAEALRIVWAEKKKLAREIAESRARVLAEVARMRAEAVIAPPRPVARYRTPPPGLRSFTRSARRGALGPVTVRC